MLRILIAGLIAFSLTACAGSVLDGATPGQRLYAADGGYKAILELAVGYRQSCLARPEIQRTTCQPLVEKIQAIDRTYSRLRGRLDDIEPAESDVRLIEASVAELRSVLASADAKGMER